MKTVGFFNVKAGVGTTTLVFHLAWMFQEIGIETVVADLDPQADLTAAFLPDQRIEEIQERGETILGALEPLLLRKEPILEPFSEEIADHLALLPGTVQLSLHEDLYAQAWSRYIQGESIDDQETFSVLTSFHQVIHRAALTRGAELVLIDAGPGVGALHRAALLACDFVVTPISTQLSTFQSLPALGLSLRKWRSAWRENLRGHEPPDQVTPSGTMTPIGYVILHRAFVREWHTRLAEEISKLYHHEVLGEPDSSSTLEHDPYCLASLKRYQGLMLLAQANRKPIFLLKPADGAIGSHAEAVQDCYRDFKQLALRVASACGVVP